MTDTTYISVNQPRDEQTSTNNQSTTSEDLMPLSPAEAGTIIDESVPGYDTRLQGDDDPLPDEPGDSDDLNTT